ncbi:MAG: hypothetical protein KAI67_03920 [Candidatus Pacebacteria bacterium]|nr:hypothetical protein [Candidatus Paceibacterota bacterium]
MENKTLAISVSLLLIVYMMSFLFNVKFFMQNEYLKTQNGLLVQSDDLLNEENGALRQKIDSLNQEISKTEIEMYELEGTKQGKIMSEMNYNCKWNCSNYLIQKDYQNKTNFNNSCHEDCRRELDRIAAGIRISPNMDLEAEYDIKFFLNYIKEDKPITFKLINQDLGNLIKDSEYDSVFARSVYEVSNLGYRVVPFPFIEENGEIEELNNLNDLYFNKNGDLVDCESSAINVELCNTLKKISANDRAEGMLLDCGSKHCNFLEAIRTKNIKHCSDISKYSLSPNDGEWIQLCVEMIKELKE